MYNLQAKKSIILLFIDGVGLGSRDATKNPFAKFKTDFFRLHGGSEFTFPGTVIETDATMGVAGLPQSATGQTALFTGYNAAQVLGRHITGFPTATLRPYLLEKSILKVLQEHGFKTTLLNSYSKEFLSRMNGPKGHRLESASSLAQKATGNPFFTIEDYLEGKSLYMDLTNWFLRQMGYSVPMVSAKINGRKLAQLSREYDFVIFEYFFTDKAGHSQSFAVAKRIIRHMDEFLAGIWEELDPEKQMLIVATDHGNLEDLSTNLHTLNPVPTILYGKYEKEMENKIKTLYDIPRAIYQVLSISFPGD